MKTKNIFLIMFVPLLWMGSLVKAQSISRSAVSSAGGTLTGGSNQVTFNIGETVIPSLSAGSSKITQGFEQPGEQIRTGTLSANMCAGSIVTVPYNAIDIGGGNTFTAELSSASGSFATPVNIGTASGNASGNITATIPVLTTDGSGYRIRVVSSSPVAKGTDNGTDITISHGLAPTVTGIVNVCPYIGTGTPITYTFASFGATSYSYILPPLVNLISSTTNSITVNFLTGFDLQANKQIKVKAVSGCGNSIQTIYYLLTQGPGTPAPIVGNTNVCPIIGSPGTYTYTIPSVVGATSYLWTAQLGTTSITHTNGLGINDTTVTVSFTNGFTSSNISVQAVNNCNTSSARSLGLVKVNPSVPGLISGPTNVCENILPGGVAAVYKIGSVPNATSYNWVTSPGTAIVTHPNGTGPLDTVITVIFQAGFTSGSITVSATNGCGTGGIRSLALSKLSPATPGVLDVIQLQSCPGRQYSYTLATLPANATSLQWVIPIAQGASLVSQTATSITVSYPTSAVNGAVTVQAFNNCGSSVIRSSAVKLPACPPEETRPSGIAGINVKIAPVERMQVNVFPIPSLSDFTMQVLTADKQMIHVRILDILGRAHTSFTLAPYQRITFGSDLKAGAYMLEVRQGNSLKTTKLFKF